MRNALISLICIFAAAACTPVAKVGKTSLGPSPVLDGGTYSTGGGITVAAQTINVGGMTALCGAWAESKHQSVLSKGAAPRVMHSGSVYLGDAVLHRDLAFMAKVAPAASYAGQPANCVVTQTPWSAGQVVKIRIPRQEVLRENSDQDGVNISVTFRQTGPGAMNPSLKSLILGN